MNAILYIHNARGFANGKHRTWDDPEILKLVNAQRVEVEAEFAALEAAQ